ncbi:MAG: DNA primase, partial [Gammaproteobacteria bacterium]|nr:DNA primase [Gammaproteobacteria bacterium]
MAGRIPQQFIQELLSRVDIADIVGERIALKKTGQNYMACCPFHNEKTPSFSVSPSKQFYHCFGCGAHGSAISFLMEYDRLEFVDAVKQLAARAGVEVPRDGATATPSQDYQTLYATLETAAKFFAAQLREPGAGAAVDYLKARGLTGAIAQEYGIGYAPAGWDHLLQHFGGDAGVRQRLLQAGLVIEKEGGGVYDRFRNRVMFPIRDARGRVVGFGGRVLTDETPKYLNSPETPVFHKGRELYGLCEARKRVRDLAQVLVVEGYMDVVGLAQYGIGNAVATLGTATTREHIERLFRVTSDVVFCFDGDNAGRKAAWRALEAALPLMTGQQHVRFMFLPEGEDPDSLVRKEGRELFAARSVTAIPLSTYLFEHLVAGADLSSIEGRARLVELARPLISKIPIGVYRQMTTARLAEITQMDETRLTRALDSGKTLEPVAIARRVRAPIIQGAPSAVRTAVKLLLQDPRLARETTELCAT